MRRHASASSDTRRCSYARLPIVCALMAFVGHSPASVGGPWLQCCWPCSGRLRQHCVVRFQLGVRFLLLAPLILGRWFLQLVPCSPSPPSGAKRPSPHAATMAALLVLSWWVLLASSAGVAPMSGSLSVSRGRERAPPSSTKRRLRDCFDCRPAQTAGLAVKGAV